MLHVQVVHADAADVSAIHGIEDAERELGLLVPPPPRHLNEARGIRSRVFGMRPRQPLAQLGERIPNGRVQHIGIRHGERPKEHDTVGEHSIFHASIFALEFFLRNTAGDRRENFVSPSDRSWSREGLGEAAYAALASGLPASEVWSMLLGVLEERARQRTPANLCQQWERDRFVQPSYIDQRTLLELDGHLFAAAKAFEAIELSPVAPLGVASVVALASQNKIVSTIRGTEVVSDPTNVLALECARRLRADAGAHVRLATSHRCVRAQPVPKLPGFAAHFRLFCMASAGHERESHAFTVDALIEHIRTHLAMLDRLEQHGYSFGDRQVKLLSVPRFASHAQRIAAALDGVPVVHAPLEQEYYDGLRFMIGVRAPAGQDIPLIDGGAFDWLRKLMSNNKMAFVASAIGAQLAAYAFRSQPPGD
jgi:hypothetical protein